MNSENKPGIIERGANISKKMDLATIALGVVAASSPVVLFGMLSYVGGDIVERNFKNRRENEA